MYILTILTQFFIIFSTGAMSPTNPSVMSPPQSCGSLSPPQQQHSQVHHSSPMKSNGMKLPTSPTHLAALRGN